MIKQLFEGKSPLMGELNEGKITDFVVGIKQKLKDGSNTADISRIKQFIAVKCDSSTTRTFLLEWLTEGLKNKSLYVERDLAQLFPSADENNSIAFSLNRSGEPKEIFCIEFATQRKRILLHSFVGKTVELKNSDFSLEKDEDATITSFEQFDEQIKKVSFNLDKLQSEIARLQKVQKAIAPKKDNWLKKLLMKL
jgi:hypothetical protein